MKLFRRESLIKKVIIAITTVLVMNFCMPTMCRAASVTEAIGEFLLAIPDGLFYVLQSFFLDDGDVRISVHSSSQAEAEYWQNVSKNVASQVNTISAFINFMFNSDFNLPHISFTPGDIFANKIPLLNANFFGKDKKQTNKVIMENWEINIGPNSGLPNGISINYTGKSRNEVVNHINNVLNESPGEITNADAAKAYWKLKAIQYYNKDASGKSKISDELNQEFTKWKNNPNIEITKNISELEDKSFTEILETVKTLDNYQSLNPLSFTITEGQTIFTPTQRQAIEYIVDANVIRTPEEVEFDAVDSVSVLKPIISTWYNILRTVAMVGLLSVLVYIGIRIVIYSASAQDKAKYKNMLKDWLIGLCLLFVLHFIMSFTMTVTDYITTIFTRNEIESSVIPVPSDLECTEEDAKDKVNFDKHIVKEGNNVIGWKANIVEKIRFLITATDEADTRTSERIAYIIMYLVLLIEVIIFTFQYIKRVITMAMLTLISPVIALTYPIDKITDGKAQGFNMWLKEYIFNALMQPMHLLLYTIIMSSAMELVDANPIYGIVALACLIPMEKLLRKIFGFGKSETAGAFSGAAGAAVVMSAIGSLQRLGKKGPHGGPNGEIRDKDAPKLYDNKRSIDAEGELLGNADAIEEEPIPEPANAKDDGFGTEGRDSDTFGSGVQVGEGRTDENNQSQLLLSQNDKPHKGENSDFIDVNWTEVDDSKDNTQPIRTMAQSRNEQPKTTSNTRRRAQEHPIRYAVGQVGKSYGRNLTRNLKPGNIVRSAAKIASGAAVGTIGLAAGVASGDLSKAVQYTATGATVGSTLGGNIADRAVRSSQDNKRTYQNARASVDDKYAAEQRYKAVMKNEGNIQYLESRYSKQEIRQVKEVAKQAAEYNITDIGQIAGLHEMKKQGYSMDQSVAIAKMSKKMGELTPKTRKDYSEYYAKKGYKQNKINSMLDAVDKFQKEST